MSWQKWVVSLAVWAGTLALMWGITLFSKATVPIIISKTVSLLNRLFFEWNIPCLMFASPPVPWPDPLNSASLYFETAAWHVVLCRTILKVVSPKVLHSVWPQVFSWRQVLAAMAMSTLVCLPMYWELLAARLPSDLLLVGCRWGGLCITLLTLRLVQLCVLELSH
jgi:hypothetical protein